MRRALRRTTEKRLAPRRLVSLPAELREAGSARFRIEVENLCEEGFACQSWQSIAIGNRVFLHIDTFAAFEARVMWREGTQHGFQFAKALHPAVIDTIARRFRVKDVVPA